LAVKVWVAEVVTTDAPDTVAELAESVVAVIAAGVVAPITDPSIVPPLMSAVSATKLSILATPSIYKSLNS
jgi:NAD/NADP transhydrogenase alpha subunit